MGFSLAMVTVTACPLMSKVIVLSVRAVTAKGPVYGGCKGGRTVSSRSMTWLQVARSL